MQDTLSENNPIYRYALHQPRVFTPFLGTEAERVFWDYFQESYTVAQNYIEEFRWTFFITLSEKADQWLKWWLRCSFLFMAFLFFPFLLTTLIHHYFPGFSYLFFDNIEFLRFVGFLLSIVIITLPVTIVASIFSNFTSRGRFVDISIAIGLLNCCYLCSLYSRCGYTRRIEIRTTLLSECQYVTSQIKTCFLSQWQSANKEARLSFQRSMVGFANDIEEKAMWIATPQPQTFQDLSVYFERSFSAFVQQEWGILGQIEAPDRSKLFWRYTFLPRIQRLAAMLVRLLITFSGYLVVHRFLPTFGTSLDLFFIVITIAIVLTWLGPSFEPVTNQAKTWYDMLRPPSK